MSETLLARTKQLLREYDLRARKGLAQYFLVDGSIVKKIIDTAQLTPSDTVIEVGPGLGVLTEALTKSVRQVIAIELDAKLAGILREKFGDGSNVTVINEDILKIELATVLPWGKETKYKVVANLPYYITSAVIRHFLEAVLKPSLMVLMVQREVAKQITAQPGEMSLLSVSVQLYGKPKLVEKVPARSFWPAPDVDSAVLRIDVYPESEVGVYNIDVFFNIVRAGFSANRKQIINSLSHRLDKPKEEVLALLERAGIDHRRRAETLTIEEWKKLYSVYCYRAVK